MVVWVTLVSSRLLTCSGPLVFNIIADKDRLPPAAGISKARESRWWYAA